MVIGCLQKGCWTCSAQDFQFVLEGVQELASMLFFPSSFCQEPNRKIIKEKRSFRRRWLGRVRKSVAGRQWCWQWLHTLPACLWAWSALGLGLQAALTALCCKSWLRGCVGGGCWRHIRALVSPKDSSARLVANWLIYVLSWPRSITATWRRERREYLSKYFPDWSMVRSRIFLKPDLCWHCNTSRNRLRPLPKYCFVQNLKGRVVLVIPSSKIPNL